MANVCEYEGKEAWWMHVPAQVGQMGFGRAQHQI